MESPTASASNGLDREQRVRGRARDLGYILRKSRRDHAIYHRDGTYTGENRRDHGLWMIVDAATSTAITGIRYELTLEDIAAFLDVRT